MNEKIFSILLILLISGSVHIDIKLTQTGSANYIGPITYPAIGLRSLARPVDHIVISTYYFAIKLYMQQNDKLHFRFGKHWVRNKARYKSGSFTI